MFTATKCKVTLKDELILEGTRSPSFRGLWMMQVTAPPVALLAVNHNAKPKDLINFAHSSLFSPANSTMLRAMQKGFLPPFPGLNENTFCKYAPRLAATVKGHLDMSRKNQKSTKEEPRDILQELLDNVLNRLCSIVLYPYRSYIGT